MNIFDNIPKQLPDELVDILVNNNGIKIERIVSKGHQSNSDFWYDQTENEWVIVLRGKARLKFENGHITFLKAGDFLNIEAHTKHQVEWTSEEVIWLAVFYP